LSSEMSTIYLDRLGNVSRYSLRIYYTILILTGASITWAITVCPGFLIALVCGGREHNGVTRSFYNERYWLSWCPYGHVRHVCAPCSCRAIVIYPFLNIRSGVQPSQELVLDCARRRLFRINREMDDIAGLNKRVVGDDRE
jgi:hypothetical protein